MNSFAASENSRPHIVFILTDDQGAWALGCAGNDEIRTPNLDRLAAEGTRFSNFFCTSPVCSPARASLLTGRIPSQHGVHDWIRGGNIGERPIAYLQGQPAYTEMLADNGYVCGLSGKWHLGDSMQPQKGFSHWYVHQTGGSAYYDAPMIRDGKLIQEPGYLTDVITDDALQFLEGRSGEEQGPFYLSVHYTAPHSPWIDNHPQQYVDLYEDCAFDSCPQEPKHPWAIPTAPWSDNQRENLKGYFAAVTAMDRNVGRILDKLEQLGIRDQTLVCFLSDNGFNCGHHGIWGKGNGTFPQNMYDTSVKVPAIFSQPGRIPQGRVCDGLVSGYDFMPTLLDYVGLDNPEAERLPGTSFLPLLLGEAEQNREDVVIFDEYGPVRMIRTREWKYVHRYPYGPHELYHLASDPDERVNRIDDASAQEQLARLKAKLERWFVRYADPARDGTREPVTGYGQLELAGPDGEGRPSYFAGEAPKPS
ncbi:sulfatase-like hydrolase/transferase [Paenibacillus doosanensis]|uniref:Choline-sulfatase n=1 Tax=Paenibacillus konkukensis TaxID=2020716 RepID=A0ABY4S000_9BACL|nr:MULTISPECIES: sulfatase-like hydrolase/transferase [Paenibacillus]MCS7460446.1 sulfatase-like hydrolase/transferase [Paenibacillus doosanensis]UQZ87473.1 Choline-sulfatase [Paenibacillus konkukensis]